MLTGASRRTRARSISNTSANTQTESSSPTVKSSTAVPPEYCPCTSAPGFTLRAITSPSIGARSVNSCVTASAPPPAEQARLRLRALHLRLGLPEVVLGRLEVALRAGVRLEELLLAAKVVLGGDQIGLALAEVGEGVADVGRFDDRQRRALLHPRARVGHDAFDPPGHRRKDVRDPQIVEGDLAAGDDLVADAVLGHRLDLDLGVAHLLRGQPDLAFGRGRDRVGRGRRAPAAGCRRDGHRDRQQQGGEARPAPRPHRGRRSLRPRHCTTCVAVADSIWKMAFQ